MASSIVDNQLQRQEDIMTAVPPPGMALRTAKRSLRKSMAQRLSQMSRTDILEQSQQVTQRILASPTYRSAQAVSIYVSMASGEVDTDSLCRHALQSGKRLYVPLFAAPSSASSTSTAVQSPTPPSSTSSTSSTFSSDMRMLRLRDLADYDGMKLNRWGIREPGEYLLGEGGREGAREGAKREDALEESTGGQGLDLILAPGVAFDCAAGRLGHGKGYYDRYLARADDFARKMGKAGPVCVALGLTPQVLPSDQRVPQDEHDRTLDGIVVPAGLLRGINDRGRWQ